MTKKEKIAVLAKAMQSRLARDGESTEWYFSPDAPEELKDLYLEHYEVRDIDYETFSDACDLVSEAYGDHPDATDDQITDDIYERASDTASVYTSDRLAYLNMWNEDEVSETMREYGMRSIADACAAWYDRQVEQQAIIIKDWVNA